jgi:hypothetical protein
MIECDACVWLSSDPLGSGPKTAEAPPCFTLSAPAPHFHHSHITSIIESFLSPREVFIRRKCFLQRRFCNSVQEGAPFRLLL